MKVLHVTGAVSPALGGPSTSVLATCRALSRRGVHVSLFTTNIANHRGLAFSAPTLLTDRPQSDANLEIAYFKPEWPWKYARSPGMDRALAERMGEFDVAHLHSVYLFPTHVAARAAKMANIPYLITPHGSFMPYLRRHNRVVKAAYHRFLGRPTWDAAAAIHFTSDTERLEAKALAIKAPGVVIPHGIDLQAFAEMPTRGAFRARFPSVGPGVVISILGRLVPRKGVELLVRAFGLVASKYPDSHLVLAGPFGGRYQGTIQRLIDELGVGDRVTLPGLVVGTQKLELLADTDIFALPSYGENFGMVVLEALAAGCAVVVSDRVDIHRELTALGACAVTECSVGSLSSILDRLLADRSARGALAARAKEAAKEFSWERSAEQLERLYDSILNQPSEPIALG